MLMVEIKRSKYIQEIKLSHRKGTRGGEGQRGGEQDNVNAGTNDMDSQLV